MSKNKARLNDPESRYARAVDACREVVEMAEETENCGICTRGLGDSGHDKCCPYLAAKQVIEDFNTAQKAPNEKTQDQS